MRTIAILVFIIISKRKGKERLLDVTEHNKSKPKVYIFPWISFAF